MKGITTGVVCSLMVALTACGGGSSSSGEPQKDPASLSSSSVSTSAVAESSSSTTTSSTLSSAPPASTSSLAESSSSQPNSSSLSSSSSSPASSSSSSQAVAQTGVFIDSAVAGVAYKTSPGGFSGFTSPTGQYLFAENDEVTFSIGEILFPSVPAKGVITPLDMAGDADSRIATNIAVLLQSLDADGDPSNGITIPDTAADAATQPVDFDQPYSAFSNQVLPVVQHADTTRTVVSETDATAHLQASLAQVQATSLVGTWFVQGDTYQYALFIIDGERYAAIDYDTSEAEGVALEMGTYSWDQKTGVVTVTQTFKSDSDLDARPPLANGNILVLDGNTLTLTDDGAVDNEPASFELRRLLPTEESPLQGGWFMDDEEEQVVFAFTDTHYFMGQMAEEDTNGQSGAEFGAYTYNAESAALVVETLMDTNGQWGLSHPCAVWNNGNHPEYEQPNYMACGPNGRDIVQTMNITGDMLVFWNEADSLNDDDYDEIAFERINGAPDGDIHLRLLLTLEQTDYVAGEHFSRDEGTATMQCNLSTDDVEQSYESWVLGGDTSRRTWLGYMPATYDPKTQKISLDTEEAVRPVAGHPGFYEKFYDTFTGTYHPGETTVITGTYIEGYDLTWDRDDSVSRCKATYSVTGVLR